MGHFEMVCDYRNSDQLLLDLWKNNKKSVPVFTLNRIAAPAGITNNGSSHRYSFCTGEKLEGIASWPVPFCRKVVFSGPNHRFFNRFGSRQRQGRTNQALHCAGVKSGTGSEGRIGFRDYTYYQFQLGIFKELPLIRKRIIIIR